MKKENSILYIDCFAGVSGDMLLSALLDLGANQYWIESELNKLTTTNEPITLQFDTVNKKGARALLFSLKKPYPLFKFHSYNKICQLIIDSKLPQITTKNALQIFKLIAVAEAKIHNVPIDQVHFHEVGAIDSIVDIVGCALAFENLGIGECISGIVKVGSGSVLCQHGIYPVPAFATLEILSGIPIESGNYGYEMTTPTGAAILRNYTTTFGTSIPLMIPESIGYGAGQRDLKDSPNLLRLIRGKKA